jgi:hypothetical protein
MGEDPTRIRREIESTRDDMGETVEAIGYKADVKSRAKEKVGAATDRIGGAGSSVKRAAQQNPIGLAVGSLAAGFLIGTLLPSSRVEDEKVGPLADDVKSQLKETGEEAFKRGKEAAREAVEGAESALPGG